MRDPDFFIHNILKRFLFIYLLIDWLIDLFISLGRLEPEMNENLSLKKSFQTICKDDLLGCFSDWFQTVISKKVF